MKSKLWMLLLPVLFAACKEKDVCVKAGLSIACAPEILQADQWAVLTVLHVYGPGVIPVKVRESTLQGVALFAKQIEMLDPNRDGSGFSLQVYVTGQ